MVSNIFRSKLHYLTLKISLDNWFADLIAWEGVHDLDPETTERRAHTKCRVHVHSEIRRGAFRPLLVGKRSTSTEA